MNLKNLLLSIVAVILSICLVGLIFLATNQNALAKVHQTICTFSKANKVSYIEDTFNLHSNYTAKASEKDENDKSKQINNKNYNKKVDNGQTSYDFTPQECNVIALNYANNHLNTNYEIDHMHSQSPTSEYAFTDMHGKHETDITVDKNGHVNTKRLYTH
ncbi:hypothetical protein ACN9UU_05075 [Staphylococcus caprae]|uniref:hypothetical protein n=1 Tax=Staphylococcus caprae TaxID=29380 RepID=UPI00055A4524|nr:hypothetical protein [Staphylococcus caprae]MBN6824870.1 hypothetical protein [Staphylococcus caprae]MBX5322142.1 hypothetical protein [Staphylococcus caprae]MDI0015004.1 hypothetical protein [Staphylococcus caprae]PAK64932.1 hypothetical protein B9K00_02975 [Staphylococcus caprae]QDW94684.1 hypothetical protein DWB96_10755 [Staphylococcus caprae]